MAAHFLWHLNIFWADLTLVEGRPTYEDTVDFLAEEGWTFADAAMGGIRRFRASMPRGERGPKTSNNCSGFGYA